MMGLNAVAGNNFTIQWASVGDQSTENCTTTCLLFSCQFDTSSKGTITTNSLGDALAACGAKVPGFKVRDICDTYKDGVISFDDFCKVSNVICIKMCFLPSKR